MTILIARKQQQMTEFLHFALCVKQRISYAVLNKILNGIF